MIPEIRIVDGQEEKRCTKCQQWKSSTLFTKDRHNGDCKACISKKNHEYYAIHKQAIRAKRKTEENRIRTNERQNAYRRANRDEENRKLREKYATDPINRAMRLACFTRRHAKKRQVGGTYIAEDIQRQYKAQKGKCYYCNTKIGNKYEVDHIIPLSREGTSNNPWNLVLTCCHCNRRKHNKLPHEWPEGGRLL